MPQHLLLGESCPMVERNFKMKASERGIEDLVLMTQVKNKPSDEI
jgi:hypothetical protein